MARQNRLFLTMFLLITIVVAATPVFAQESVADNMKIVVEKMRADKKLLVSQNMKFTEAEAKSFWPVYEQYQNELFLLRVRTVNLLKEYENSYENMNNKTAKKLLDEFMTIETLRLKLLQYYLPKFRKVISDTKVARYYQIENKLQAALMYELAREIPLVVDTNR